jgi:hypothetical protein
VTGGSVIVHGASVEFHNPKRKLRSCTFAFCATDFLVRREHFGDGQGIPSIRPCAPLMIAVTG